MTRLTALVLAVSVSFSAASIAAIAGCRASVASTDTATNPTEPTGYGDLVGKWQFVYTPERRATHEVELAQRFSDPTELARAKEEAVEEAANSEIEFTADHMFLSRVLGTEIYRAKLNVGERPDKSIELSTAENPQPWSMVLRDPNTMVIHAPKKGDLVYTRVR